MSGDTKVTWNSLPKRKTFSIWRWWHILGTMHSLGCTSGLFLLIAQQPLPGRGGEEKGLLFDENPDFGLKTLQMRERPKKQKQEEKGSFSGKNTKNRLTAPIFWAQLSNMIWTSLFPIGFVIPNGFWMKKGPFSDCYLLRMQRRRSRKPIQNFRFKK